MPNRHWNKTTKEYKQQADKRRTPGPTFKTGVRVYLSTKFIRLGLPSRKLGPKYIGPFPIRKIINPITVELELPARLGKIHPVFHASLLKPVTSCREHYTQPGPVVGAYYEIQEILDSRYHRKTLQYLVRWKGYPDIESSWVRHTDVNATKLIKRFYKAYPWKPGGALPA